MKTDKWTAALAQLTSDYETKCAGLTSDQLNWKPNPKTWSAGQVIEHVILVNESYYPVFEALRSGTYKPSWMSKIGFMVRFFSNMILNSVEPTRKRKTRTLGIWNPSQSMIDENIAEHFTAHHQRMIDEITQLEPLLDKGIIISSPANSNVVYPLEIALDIIISHERRHLNQILEVLEIMPNA